MSEAGIATVREAYWWEASRKRSDRLNFLRGQRWRKGATGSVFQKGIQFDTTRTYWYTKMFKETENEPWVLRRAKSLEALLDNQPIFIRDGSRIVGYPASKPNMLVMHCDGNADNLRDFYYDREGYIPEQDMGWFLDAIEYWDKICARAHYDRYMTEEEKNASLSFCQFTHSYMSGLSSAQVHYDFIFEHGFNGILEMIEQQMYEAEKQLHTGLGGSHIIGLPEKMDEWRAMRITMKAAIRYADRYNRLAKIIAENFETEPKRKIELLKVSEICAKVPANPPEHLHEAIQMQDIVNVMTKFIERQHTGHGFRPDQLWHPYYVKDCLNDKSLTREEALDLIGEWQLQVWEREHAMVRVERSLEGAGTVLPVITLGGVLDDGTDACNELSDLILEASRLTRCNFPSYVLRYHPKMRVATLRESFETIKAGLGYPVMQNDTVLTDTLLIHSNQTLEEARSWANVVCLSPAPTKGRGGQAIKYTGGIQASIILEVTLHNGVAPRLGMQAGPQTGDVTQMDSFEELWEAYVKQLDYHAAMYVRTRNLQWLVEGQYFQQPLLSACFERCIKSGYDCVDYRGEGGVGNPWQTATISNEAGDALYAIKKLVFDDKKYTMAQLLECMAANWQGYERMRMDCANVPKWGNDIDEVDAWMVKAHHALRDALYKNRSLTGLPFLVLPQNGGAYQMACSMLGPLPNGRSFGDPAYDGGTSPGSGMDKKGPTAVLRSCAKIDYRTFKSSLLNQRLSQTQMAGDKGFQLFQNYVKSWYDLGLPHVQFNCTDSETLRAAQSEPEKYGELIVRVAGYSAHFVELARYTQDTIIARTLQEL